MNHDEYNCDGQILIFHKEFTEENAKFPLFALKVLSGFCGGNEIAFNVEKVILVEKQFAMRVFGQGPGCQALRCSYYLAYSAAAIAAGIKDPETLSTYGKRDLLRGKKSRLIQEATVPTIELKKKKKKKTEDHKSGSSLHRAQIQLLPTMRLDVFLHSPGFDKYTFCL